MVVGDVVRVMNKSSSLCGRYGVVTSVSGINPYHMVRLDGSTGATPFAHNELAIVTPRLLKTGEWVAVTTGAYAGREGVVCTVSASGESALVEIGGRVGKVWVNLSNLTHSLYLARCGDIREAPHSEAFDAIWQRVVGGSVSGGFGVGAKVRVVRNVFKACTVSDHTGMAGVIIEKLKGYDWQVALEGDNAPHRPFFEHELELVKEEAE